MDKKLNQTTQHISTIKSLPIWLVIVMVSVVLGVVIKKDLYPQVQVPNTMPQVQKTQTSNWQKIGGQRAVFKTMTTFQPLNKTFVSLPIKYSGEPIDTLLSFDSSSSAQLHVYIIYSSQIEKLHWDHIVDGDLSLYQRKKTYTSVSALIAGAAPNKVWLTGEVKNLPALKRFSSNELLDNTSMDAVDYIVTTYQPLEKYGDGYIYNRTLNASSALLSAKKEMSWVIQALIPDDQNPYYIGEIHIDYRY